MNFKSVTLFVASLIVVILVSMSINANGEENKTITPKEFVSNVAEDQVKFLRERSRKN